ncbi:MAG: hypothetical protein WBB74_01740 [Gaiellaceae bacterium]
MGDKPAVRILVLEAEEGEGHRAVASALEAGLLAGSHRVEVIVRDSLDAVGRLVPLLSRDLYRVQLRWLAWTYGLECLLFTRFPPGRALARFGLALFGGRPLRRLVESHQPDIVVSTHPVPTNVMGHLRRRGKVRVPCVSTISDFGVHALWAHPGIDAHLVVHTSCVRPVERVAGKGSAVVASGLVKPDFALSRTQAEARSALDLPSRGPVVVISGGGWGLGRLESAVRAALGVPDASVVCVCGRNERAYERVSRAFADEARVRVLAFTDRMSDLLAAGDVLVHATGGVSCLEALARGCALVAYGVPPGHARWNAKALESLGLGRTARSEPELTRTLARLTGEPRAVPRLLAAVPAAAAILGVRPRQAATRAPRIRRRLAVTAVAAGSVVMTGWTFASTTPYPRVLSTLRLPEITAVQTDRPEVGLVIDAPPTLVPVLTDQLARARARASFGAANFPPQLVRRLAARGDEALPALDPVTPQHWLAAGRELRREARQLRLSRRFLYLPRDGFSLGEYLAALDVGGTPIVGSLRLDAGESLDEGVDAGDVVVVSVGVSASAASETITKVLSVLGRSGLRAVSLSELRGSPASTRPTASERASIAVPISTSRSEIPRAVRIGTPAGHRSPTSAGASATGTSVVKTDTTGAT